MEYNRDESEGYSLSYELFSHRKGVNGSMVDDDFPGSSNLPVEI